MSFKIIGIGEVLWDLLPSGSQLGGAPANFVYHAHALGADARVVTRVGDDDFGRAIIRRFKSQGIADGTVQVDKLAPTGTATVQLSREGVPEFTIHENAAWDRLELTMAALKAVQEANAICFGTLAQRNRSAASVIQHLVAAAPLESLRVFDINLRQKFFTPQVIKQSMGLANVLKLSDQELPVVAAMFQVNGTVEQQIESLAAQFGLRLVALTRGSRGSLLYQMGGFWSDLPGSSIKVVDTVGAGDSFSAALVMGILGGMSLGQVHSFAAEIADYVCSCQGATPPLPKRFCQRFISRDRETKILPPVSALFEM